MRSRESCPRCEKPGLKSWNDLNDEEREMINRLPLSRDYSIEERQAHHRWCTRCWYEATDSGTHDA